MLIGDELFESRFDAYSVTRKTKYVTVKIKNTRYAIFDIPGLIENSENNMEENKREIYQAFYMIPNSVIVFIFTTSNGRINYQDIAAFKALNAAYDFYKKSLLFIVNNIPKERPDGYEYDVITLLIRALDIEFQDNVYFLDQIPRGENEEFRNSRDDLWEKVATRTSSVHEKKMDIILEKGQLKELEDKIKSLEEKLQNLHNAQAEKLQNQHNAQNETIKKLDNDVEQLRKTLERVMAKSTFK
ncbi:unnamed protein product, partial [Rotaria magnacalcarata]